MNRMYKGEFGLEREAMRVNVQGVVSEQAHPEVFGELNPYIQRDFAEAQIEMITPPCDSIDKMVAMMRDISSVVLNNIGDDLLWNQSNPPIIKDAYRIPVANFQNDKSKVAYREYLLKRYGLERSIISGTHFNFSLDDSYLKYLHQGSLLSFDEFKNKLYLKLAKYILRDRWFFMYLTNASPIFHNSYYHSCVDKSNMKENGDCIIDGMNSLRNSICGYRNKVIFYLDYSSLDKYDESVSASVEKGIIISESELYAPLRLKRKKDGGIDYIELRFLDIYPFDQSGVNSIDLKYLHMYILSKVSEPDFDFNESLQEKANYNADVMAMSSDFEGYRGSMLEVHSAIKDFVRNNPAPYDTEMIFSSVEERIASFDNSYVAKLKEAYDATGFINYHIEQAKSIKKEVLDYPFVFSSYPSLELSSKILIQAAIKRGYAFDVLDEASNFITLKDPITHQKQLIMQATKTNLDGYASVLAMENKAVSKQILGNHSIRVPKGGVYTEIPDVSLYEDKSIVIKPNSTNFGEGISIFPDGTKANELKQAFEFAFSKDSTVLVEEFIKGREYRFLVIDQKVVGVLHRRAANVVGDGINSILELIAEKNTHPYRGKNYTTPLEVIEVDDLVLSFLKLQGRTLNDIPSKGEVVYLRENSNISTGGESVDVTDETHQDYKDIAIKAAKAFGVSISGIDIIIDDISKPASSDNYSVLELNFNPAIHIHTYPLVGKNRYPADILLNALFEKEVK